jgi:hypothetical protein
VERREDKEDLGCFGSQTATLIARHISAVGRWDPFIVGDLAGGWPIATFPTASLDAGLLNGGRTLLVLEFAKDTNKQPFFGPDAGQGEAELLEPNS